VSSLKRLLLMTAFLAFLLIGQTSPSPPARLLDDLAPPVRVEAAGKPIDTAVGHAAPFVGDFDGDGVNDLLVGQFGDGLLWIFRNEGSNSDPRLAAGVQFKGGEKEGRVPSG